MKTYSFNLLPQKSKALVHKEEKRDNYSIAVAILPLTAVIIWLTLVLVNVFILGDTKRSLEKRIASYENYIQNDLSPILIAHGEMVLKTNALANVIEKDIKPEQLFSLIDKIYSKQDPTVKVDGYYRNTNGSFSVSISTISYLRLAEITDKFMLEEGITDVKLEDASLDKKTNFINGRITFNFIYEEG